jgi:cytoskeletal protein CcmA (bactofilin family)
VNNSVTIGPEGSIKADVHAQIVYVEGVVHGDLFASERVVIRKDAKVSGSITAPSVSLDEGAKFKGTIEMDVEEGVETPIASGRSAGVRPVSPVSKSNGDSIAATPQEPAAEAGPAR